VVGIDVGAVAHGGVAAGRGTLAGAAGVAVAGKIAVAQVGTGGVAGAACFDVGRVATVEVEHFIINVAAETGAAHHVASAVRRVAGAESANAVAFAERTVWCFRKIVWIECAGSAHDGTPKKSSNKSEHLLLFGSVKNPWQSQMILKKIKTCQKHLVANVSCKAW